MKTVMEPAENPQENLENPLINRSESTQNPDFQSMVVPKIVQILQTDAKARAELCQWFKGVTGFNPEPLLTQYIGAPPPKEKKYRSLDELLEDGNGFMELAEMAWHLRKEGHTIPWIGAKMLINPGKIKELIDVYGEFLEEQNENKKSIKVPWYLRLLKWVKIGKTMN